jgi:PIN domain nuclease of toxin-antitoxin system
MNFLLDTHTFIWFIEGNESLPSQLRPLISNPEHGMYLSIASLWEMAIKVGQGKLDLGYPFEILIPEQLQRNTITVLGISLEHIFHVTKLPLHHRDPFDRLIIAQSLVNAIPVIGVDSSFDPYGVTRIW